MQAAVENYDIEHPQLPQAGLMGCPFNNWLQDRCAAQGRRRSFACYHNGHCFTLAFDTTANDKLLHAIVFDSLGESLEAFRPQAYVVHFAADSATDLHAQISKFFECRFFDRMMVLDSIKHILPRMASVQFSDPEFQLLQTKLVVEIVEVVAPINLPSTNSALATSGAWVHVQETWQAWKKAQELPQAPSLQTFLKHHLGRVNTPEADPAPPASPQFAAPSGVGRQSPAALANIPRRPRSSRRAASASQFAAWSNHFAVDSVAEQAPLADIGDAIGRAAETNASVAVNGGVTAQGSDSPVVCIAGCGLLQLPVPSSTPAGDLIVALPELIRDLFKLAKKRRIDVQDIIEEATCTLEPGAEGDTATDSNVASFEVLLSCQQEQCGMKPMSQFFPGRLFRPGRCIVPQCSDCHTAAGEKYCTSCKTYKQHATFDNATTTTCQTCSDQHQKRYNKSNPSKAQQSGGPKKATPSDASPPITQTAAHQQSIAADQEAVHVFHDREELDDFLANREEEDGVDYLVTRRVIGAAVDQTNPLFKKENHQVWRDCLLPQSLMRSNANIMTETIKCHCHGQSRSKVPLVEGSASGADAMLAKLQRANANDRHKESRFHGSHKIGCTFHFNVIHRVDHHGTAGPGLIELRAVGAHTDQCRNHQHARQLAPALKQWIKNAVRLGLKPSVVFRYIQKPLEIPTGGSILRVTDFAISPDIPNTEHFVLFRHLDTPAAARRLCWLQAGRHPWRQQSPLGCNGSAGVSPSP